MRDLEYPILKMKDECQTWAVVEGSQKDFSFFSKESGLWWTLNRVEWAENEGICVRGLALDMGLKWNFDFFYPPTFVDEMKSDTGEYLLSFYHQGRFRNMIFD